MSSLTGDAIVSRFRLLEELGRGELGVTYRAADPQAPGHLFAVKVIRRELRTQPGYRDAFARETQIALELVHPHLARLDYAGTTGNLFAASDFIPGMSLGQRLKSAHRLTLLQTLQISHQTAAALEALHATGLTHQSLTAANIRLTRHQSGKEIAVVTDFGLARAAATSLKPASPGAVNGRRHPGNAQAAAPAFGKADDVYAQAVLVVHCLTGRVPAPRATVPSRQDRIPSQTSRQAIKLGPGIPHAVKEVLSWGLQDDPARRPESPEVFYNALEDAARVVRKSRPAASVALAASLAPRPRDIPVISGPGPTPAVTPVPVAPADPVAAHRSEPVIPKPLPRKQARRFRPTAAQRRRYAKPHVRTRPPRRMPKWPVAAGLIVAATLTAVFVGGSGNKNSGTSGTAASGTTSKSAASHTSARPARLTGSANAQEVALFSHVSGYALGSCSPRREAPLTSKGWLAALTCRPAGAPVQGIIVRQFSDVSDATADASARVVSADQTGQPSCAAWLARLGARPKYATVNPSLDLISEKSVSCYSSAANHISLWVYSSDGVQMALLQNPATSNSVVNTWLAKHVQQYLPPTG